MHLRRNSSVLHRNKISFYGCKRRPEIMRNVGYKFPLIVLLPCYLARHICKRSRKISHLILRLNRELVAHISHRILLCRGCNLPKRQIHQLREKDKDYERQKKQHKKHQIRNIQKRICRCFYRRQRLMNNNICLNFPVCGYRRKNT